MSKIIKGQFGAFRDFAAEKHIGRDDVKVYALSVHSSNSKCGQDCHEVSVLVGAEEKYLGEVADGDGANDRIAEMVEESGI